MMSLEKEEVLSRQKITQKYSKYLIYFTDGNANKNNDHDRIISHCCRSK